MFKRTSLALLALTFIASLTACGDATLTVDDHSMDHDTELDLALEGIPSGFDQNLIMSDDVFEGRVYGMSVEGVQAFLESNPYNQRSWLAGMSVNGKSAAQAIVSAGEAHNVSPLVLLVRMQAEQSLVSATSRPGDRRVDWAFGCGCPDNRACDEQYRGLDRQLDCAAKYLRENYERSVRNEGSYFHRGESKRTLDGATVTPRNHATASHYNYTPHKSAAKLTWQILTKYAAHAATLDPSLTRDSPWIGDTCTSTDQCPAHGECVNTMTGGMCSTACDGFCQDRPGKAQTFCVSLDGGNSGSCVQRAEQLNNFCRDLPGTGRLTLPRFVKTSGVSVIEREVCVPTLAPGPVEPAPTPTEPAPVEPNPPADSGDETDPSAWIGTECSSGSQCNFAEGQEMGVCFSSNEGGACSISCEGFCPDRDGFAPTFCVSVDGGNTGQCVPRAHDRNNFCQGMTGMMRIELPRHVGSSGVRNASREVCVPYIAPAG